MKLCVFDDHRLGVWSDDDSIRDITSVVGAAVRPRDRLNALIERWDEAREEILETLPAWPSLPRAVVTLRVPQPMPTKIVAAPANHRAHTTEMEAVTGAADGSSKTIEEYVGFLKAPSSLIGPDRAIELPDADRRVDFEGELGIIMGRRCHRVPRTDALRYVFGYVPLLDVTLRGGADRSYRKSFDTFTPIGPALVTADEIQDPCRLDLTLSVNGVVRQRANTADFIYDVTRLIEVYSQAMTLEPGDIIASGTPDGVGRLHPGDQVSLTIEGLPTLMMNVRLRADRPDPAGAATGSGNPSC